MWQTFLSTRNDIEILAQPVAFAHTLCTDASLTGYGWTCESAYIQGSFPVAWAKLPIHVLELFPIFLLLSIFRTKLQNSAVRVLCDNQAIVHCINNFTSKDKKLMVLLRHMTLIMLQHNMVVKAVHLPGKLNTVCDALSRQAATGEMLARYNMDLLPTPIPAYLRPHNFRL